MSKNMSKVSILCIVVLFLGISSIMPGCGCGRTASRMMGREHRQVLEVQNMEKFLSISFDKHGSSTDKNISYVGTDGYVYTQEFKDSGVLQGTIRWVPANEDQSMIQSRKLSRWTGKPVDTKLPDDCAEVLVVDVSYKSGSKRVKNLTFRSTDGSIYAKEYRDGFIDRKFSGWLEIKPVKQ